MHTHEDGLRDVHVKRKEGSVVEISGTYSKEYLAKERAHTLPLLATRVQIDGFRTGSAPEAMLVAKLGEPYIQEKTAEHALEHELQKLLMEHQVAPLVPPHIHIILNKDGSAGVTVTATVYPTVTLPNYAQVAREVMSGAREVVVSEEDVLDALIHFRRERLRVESIEKLHAAGTPDEDALKRVLAETAETALENLPPLDEAFVTQLGFADVAAFEDHVRKELHAGKKEQARSERRAHMLKMMCEKPVADVPLPLIEYELAKMEASLAEYLAQAGQTLEGYFAKTKKTRAELHTEWHTDALARAQQQLALIEIAKREHIQENQTELETLVTQILKQQPSAERQAVHSHYQVLLRNEAVMQWLEGQK